MSNDTSSKKKLMKVFWILLVITIIEIVWGMFISHGLPKFINALFFLSFTLIKAGYIVAEFMHLKYEHKAFRMAVLVPLVFFFWFIIAFCYDGGAFLENKKKFNSETTLKANPATDHQAHH